MPDAATAEATALVWLMFKLLVRMSRLEYEVVSPWLLFRASHGRSWRATTYSMAKRLSYMTSVST